MAKRIKNSVGIWSFDPCATRFIPGGYHPEKIDLTIEERTEEAVKRLDSLVDGFEFHYPDEANLDCLVIQGINLVLFQF